MATHRVRLVLDDVGSGGYASLTALQGIRVSNRGGAVFVADCKREATTFADAVLDAIRDVETTIGRTCVVRVEPDDLVNASAIARRVGRTRQSVAQLIAGQRGPGAFPPPALWIDHETRLWRWSDVVQWFDAVTLNVQLDRTAAEFIAMVNGELQSRHHRLRLAHLNARVTPHSERFAVEIAFPEIGEGRRWRGARAELPEEKLM